MGCTLGNLASRLVPLRWHLRALCAACDGVTLGVIGLSIFVPAPASAAASFWFGTLASYGNLLTLPLQMLAVYLYSHNQSTLDDAYHLTPQARSLTRQSLTPPVQH